MRAYFNSLRFRISGIILTIGLSIVVVPLIAILFSERINAISGQIAEYQYCDYQNIYVLNYSVNHDNEFVFPDTGVQLYVDKDGSNRIAASCLMIEDNTKYTLSEFAKLDNITAGDIVISENVAVNYNLEVGDTIYAMYPYSTRLFELIITDIAPTEYDFLNPNILNKVGVVYLSADTTYIESVSNKYILFSDVSLGQELSQYPQALDLIISKNDNFKKVFYQGMPTLIVELIFLLAVMLIVECFYFRYTRYTLRRLVLKGFDKKLMFKIPVLEKLLIIGSALGVSFFIVAQFIKNNSFYTSVFFAIPIFMLIINVFVTGIVGIIKSK